MFIPTMINEDWDVRHNGIYTEKNHYGKIGEEFETWLLKAVDGFDMMQCTGMKDKYGNEIYEKDIVEYDDMIMHVIWDEINARFIFHEPMINHVRLPSSGCKILGNIYETKELIVT